MATIQEFILRFKTEGTNNLKALKDDIRDLTNNANPLNSSLGNLAGRMGPLASGAAAAAGAFALLGARALQLAGDLEDIAGATGVSTGVINTFAGSLIAAGGKAEDAGQILGKLNQSIQEAASGNENLQKSFQKLGVFITDASGQVRSTSDILKDITERFQSGELSATQYAGAIDILGKNVNRLELAKLSAADNPAITEATKNIDRFNDEIDKLNKLVKDNLIITFGEFAKAINEGGISGGIAKITESIGNLIAEILNAPTDAIAGFLNLFGAGIKDPVGLGTPLKALVERAKREREQYQAEMKKAAEAKAAAEKALKGTAGTAPLGPAGGGFGAVPEATLKAIEDSKNRIAQSGIEARRQSELQYANEINRVQINAKYELEKAIADINAKERLSQSQKDAEIAAKRVEIEARAQTEIAKIRERQGQQLRQVQQISKEYEKQTRLQIAALDFQTEMVGKSEEERQIAEAQRNLFIDYVNQFDALEKRRMSLGTDEKYLNDELVAQQDNLYKLYLSQDKVLVTSIRSLQTANLLEKDREQTLANIVKSYDEQVQRSQKLGEILQGVNAKIAEENQGPSPAQLAGMTSIQKKIEEIRQSTKSAAQEAARAFAQAFSDDGDGLTPERAEELRRGLDDIAGAYSKLSTVQEEIAVRNYEQSRSFAVAWKEAYTSYFENAYTAADQARNIFSTFTRGMEDAITNFVKTGKLSFKDLANTILEQIIRIQVQRASATMFGGGAGGGGLLGGIFSGIGKIFGFANGGTPPINRPSLVGERGPELFIPRSAGTIIPNTETMAALAGTGGTTVTYNIQAVDAASFRSLVARDPQFMFQVTERGRRSQPTRSRV